MENPCEECLVKVNCRDMCEEAKPYFKSLVKIDKNYQQEYWDGTQLKKWKNSQYRDKKTEKYLEKYLKEVKQSRLPSGYKVVGLQKVLTKAIRISAVIGAVLMSIIFLIIHFN